MTKLPTAGEVSLAWANGKKWDEIVRDFEIAVHQAYAEGFDSGYNAASRQFDDDDDSETVGMW